jgi:F0F1-type ATP synthase membrane subunit c/vacuolar-type H+-ATPase subunit K
METSLSNDPMSTGWVLFCGTIMVGAALKIAGGRIAESVMVAAPKRPSLGTTMVVGFLLREAVSRIGSDALGRQADR